MIYCIFVMIFSTIQLHHINLTMQHISKHILVYFTVLISIVTYLIHLWSHSDNFVIRSELLLINVYTIPIKRRERKSFDSSLQCWTLLLLYTYIYISYKMCNRLWKKLFSSHCYLDEWAQFLMWWSSRWNRNGFSFPCL